MDAWSGQILDGRYRLLGRLGSGGAGSVYRAMPLAGGAPVAVKLLEARVGQKEDLRERFEREARALNGLSHPHLIKLLDFGIAGTTPYIVTELLNGTPLDRLIAKRPLPPHNAFELALGVVAGLAHAHAHGVLHRDVKPSNVFVAALAGGVLHAKLLDFGLARFVDHARWGKHETLTEEGSVIGTPTYMPPEQGFGGRADARSDVYSVGCVLYELLAGRPPFVRESRTSLIRAHAMDPIELPSLVRPGLWVHPDLQAILLKTLAKEPAARYEDARVLLRALQELPEPVAELVG
ncbi:MAG: serine/threonine protein kinase [Sandaracinaceae bacterium]|nr:serine/threonine protein kinase [Sandaracinaceae bacterium]